MENTKSRPLSGENVAGNVSNPAVIQWQKALQILEQVQDDYSLTKNQLETICGYLSRKEITTREELRRLLSAVSLTSGNFENKTLQDVQKSEGATENQPAAPSKLRAYCFGGFEVYLDWSKIEVWHSLKSKSLFKYLVNYGKKPVLKDVLIETLWQGCDPESGNNNLKSAIYTLRKTVAKNSSQKITSPIIVFSEGLYSIDPALDLWIDVSEFKQHWQSGLHFEKSGNMEQAISHYQAAVELYRGDYLEDDPYTEWTLLQRESLKDTYLSLLTKLIAASFKAEDYDSCIVYSQKILSKDSCHEESYRWLMLCYSRLGQVYRALQWYDICAATLKRELDSEPDRKTKNLHNRLINRQPI